LSADHSDALVGQIMQGSLMTISDSEANHNRPALTKSSNQENAKVVPLTPREREVIKFLADGHGNKGTAAILGISVKTVEAHKERIMLKLGLHTNTELLHYAIKNKILGLSDM
jgi:DNA-binding NarL/FixJ family response regulator